MGGALNLTTFGTHAVGPVAAGFLHDLSDNPDVVLELGATYAVEVSESVRGAVGVRSANQ